MLCTLQNNVVSVLMTFDVARLGNMASAATWENLKTTCKSTDRPLMWRTATTVVAVCHIMLQQL
jgi:hypothetical protein